MNVERPVFHTRPEHLPRIYRESNDLDVRAARITTGTPNIPALDGVAVLVTGQARIILPVHKAWDLCNQLADTLEQLENHDDGEADLRRLDFTDANGDPEPQLETIPAGDD